MAGRTYEQRLRAENAEHTRRRILDAVYQRLREAPTEPVSLDQVARLARVVRSTIYLVFGSAPACSTPSPRISGRARGLPALTEAVAHPDAREHLRGGVAAATRMLAADRDIYRVLYSMAQLDPDSVGGAVAKMNKERSGGMAHLARRLGEDGLLRPDVTVDEAANVLWMLCSFECFDLLYTDRGLTVDETINTIITTIERALIE